MQAETQAKCREITQAYEQQAREAYDKAMAAGLSDCELGAQRVRTASNMEVKRTLLNMKQSAVDKVMEASVERICSLPDERYIDFLARLSASAAFTGTEEVVFNRRDCKSGTARAVVAKANDLLKKGGTHQPKLTVAADYGDFAGGIIVRQGDIEVNCTVEILVEMSRDKLANDIAKTLFDE